jgi:hypothetical protein
VIDIRFYLYAQAAKWWNLSFVLAVTAPLASVLAVWNDSPWALYVIALLSLVTPICIAWSREIANTNIIRADKCRRLILFEDGLGWPATKEDLAEIRAWAINVQLKQAPFIKPYYASTKPKGANRIADIVTESSFFTTNLAGKAAFGLFMLCLGAAIAVAIILHLSGSQTSINTGSGYSLIAKSIAVIISALISGDFLILAKKYYDLKGAADRVFQRCASVRDQKKAGADLVLPIVEDYGIALLQAPPIPGWLYKHYRDELNRIYRASHGCAEEHS